MFTCSKCHVEIIPDKYGHNIREHQVCVGGTGITYKKYGAEHYCWECKGKLCKVITKAFASFWESESE